MRVVLGKIGHSWLQFIINVFVFLLFVLIVNLIKPAVLEITDEIWCDIFVRWVFYAALGGFLFHIVSIIIFAVGDPGNMRTYWWVLFLINVFASIGEVSVFLYFHPTFDLALTIIAVAIFLVMYMASYIFATLFMPREIRFANPIASAILK